MHLRLDLLFFSSFAGHDPYPKALVRIIRCRQQSCCRFCCKKYPVFPDAGQELDTGAPTTLVPQAFDEI